MRQRPGQIVGALANEGGLNREDFGAITIRPDFSIVELPADLDRSVLDRLRDTQIAGKYIEIKPDRFAQNHNKGTNRGGRGPRQADPARGKRPYRKPRY